MFSGCSIFLDAAFQEAVVWNIAGRESDEAQAKLMSVRQPSFSTQAKWPYLLELTTTTGLLIALMALCEEQMHSAINSHRDPKRTHVHTDTCTESVKC